MKKAPPTVATWINPIHPGLTLHVEIPAQPYSFKQFMKAKGPYQVAHDGFTFECGENFQTRNLANDHHGPTNRIRMMSACKQLLRQIRLGLWDLFLYEGAYQMGSWILDPDNDSTLSVWQALHPKETQKVKSALGTLVDIVDMLDSTAATITFDPTSELIQKVKTVFRPYELFRGSGKLEQKDPFRYLEVVLETFPLIDRFIKNPTDIPATKLATKFNPILEDKELGIILAEEIGVDARYTLRGKGFGIYVLAKENPDNTWKYTIGSTGVGALPSKEIQGLLNIREAGLDYQEPKSRRQVNKNPHFWGCDTLIGNHRQKVGSTIPPKEVFHIIQTAVAQWREHKIPPPKICKLT